MLGVEGDSPRLSLGDSKGVFSSEREYPLWCRGAHAAPPPALARENQGTPLEKGVKKTRHTLVSSLSADFTGLVLSVLAVRLFLGG